MTIPPAQAVDFDALTAWPNDITITQKLMPGPARGCTGQFTADSLIFLFYPYSEFDGGTVELVEFKLSSDDGTEAFRLENKNLAWNSTRLAYAHEESLIRLNPRLVLDGNYDFEATLDETTTGTPTAIPGLLRVVFTY